MDTNLIILISILGVFLVAYLQFKNKKPPAEAVPAGQTSRPIIQTDMTLKELSQYNGETRPEIYISLKGTIYDVSSSGTSSSTQSSTGSRQGTRCSQGTMPRLVWRR